MFLGGIGGVLVDGFGLRVGGVVVVILVWVCWCGGGDFSLGVWCVDVWLGSYAYALRF